MNDIYDIAALTARIRGKKVALFEHLDFSRKLRRAEDIDNYLGLPHRTGTAFMQEMADHALAHEPDVIREKVISVFAGKTFTIACKETMYKARTVIIATGVASSTLFRGEKELLGRGVSYCATCDGMLYRGKKVAVISYGREGESDAAYLAELCAEVHYLPLYRGDVNLRTETITLHEPCTIRAIEGEKKAERLVTSKGDLDVDGVFIIRESDPVDSLIKSVAMDGTHIAVDRQMKTNIADFSPAATQQENRIKWQKPSAKDSSPHSARQNTVTNRQTQPNHKNERDVSHHRQHRLHQHTEPRLTDEHRRRKNE